MSSQPQPSSRKSYSRQQSGSSRKSGTGSYKKRFSRSNSDEALKSSRKTTANHSNSSFNCSSNNNTTRSDQSLHRQPRSKSYNPRSSNKASPFFRDSRLEACYSLALDAYDYAQPKLLPLVQQVQPFVQHVKQLKIERPRCGAQTPNTDPTEMEIPPQKRTRRRRRNREKRRSCSSNSTVSHSYSPSQSQCSHDVEYDHDYDYDDDSLFGASRSSNCTDGEDSILDSTGGRKGRGRLPTRQRGRSPTRRSNSINAESERGASSVSRDGSHLFSDVDDDVLESPTTEPSIVAELSTKPHLKREPSASTLTTRASSTRGDNSTLEDAPPRVPPLGLTDAAFQAITMNTYSNNNSLKKGSYRLKVNRHAQTARNKDSGPMTVNSILSVGTPTPSSIYGPTPSSIVGASSGAKKSCLESITGSTASTTNSATASPPPEEPPSPSARSRGSRHSAPIQSEQPPAKSKTFHSSYTEEEKKDTDTASMMATARASGGSPYVDRNCSHKSPPALVIRKKYEGAHQDAIVMVGSGAKQKRYYAPSDALEVISDVFAQHMVQTPASASMSSKKQQQQRWMLDFSYKDATEWELLIPFLEATPPRNSVQTAATVSPSSRHRHNGTCHVEVSHVPSLLPWFAEFQLSTWLHECDTLLSRLKFAQAEPAATTPTEADVKDVLLLLYTALSCDLPRTQEVGLAKLESYLRDAPHLFCAGSSGNAEIADKRQQSLQRLIILLQCFPDFQQRLWNPVVMSYLPPDLDFCEVHSPLGRDELLNNPLFPYLLREGLNKKALANDKAQANANKKRYKEFSLPHRLDQIELDEDSAHDRVISIAYTATTSSGTTASSPDTVVHLHEACSNSVQELETNDCREDMTVDRWSPKMPDRELRSQWLEQIVRNLKHHANQHTIQAEKEDMRFRLEVQRQQRIHDDGNHKHEHEMCVIPEQGEFAADNSPQRPSSSPKTGRNGQSSVPAVVGQQPSPRYERPDPHSQGNNRDRVVTSTATEVSALTSHSAEERSAASSTSSRRRFEC